MTTKTTAKATKTAKDNTAEMTNKVTVGAREFVKRTTDTAQERVETAYETSKTYNAQIEDTLKRAATGYANMLGGIAEAAFSNVNHTLAAVEKLAEAKTVSDAMKVQSDFVREHSAQNMEHVRSAYDYVRDVAAENAGSLRDGYAKMWPSSDKKAA
ncbi:MAG: phasin family protein [Sulfitobacter sp.]